MRLISCERIVNIDTLALKEGNINQIMYVPTEANIPITEATRIR